MKQSGNGLTPAGEFPLHLHIEVSGLENTNEAFVFVFFCFLNQIDPNLKVIEHGLLSQIFHLSNLTKTDFILVNSDKAEHAKHALNKLLLNA